MVTILLLTSGCAEPLRDYSKDSARTIEGIFVVGDDLSREDVLSIQAAISASTKDIDKRIIAIYQKGPSNVEVMTGEIRGSTDGGGDIIILKKVDGHWEIIDNGGTRTWVS
jgi:hypothetical protein